MKKFFSVILVLTLVSFALAVPRQKVIVEVATGTWWGYCPGTAMGADDLGL